MKKQSRMKALTQTCHHSTTQSSRRGLRGRRRVKGLSRHVTFYTPAVCGRRQWGWSRPGQAPGSWEGWLIHSACLRGTDLQGPQGLERGTVMKFTVGEGQEEEEGVWGSAMWSKHTCCLTSVAWCKLQAEFLFVSLVVVCSVIASGYDAKMIADCLQAELKAKPRSAKWPQAER